VLSDPPAYLLFWGKSRGAEPAPAPQYHPIAYHLLDVAAVVDAILTCRPLALQRAARLLRLPEEGARRLLVALAGLHDLGKFAPAFQAKAEEHWPDAVLGLLNKSRVIPGVHTEDGYALWADKFGGIGDWATERLWPGADDALFVLAPAVFGHHGRPVDMPNGGVRQRFKGSLATARECAESVLSLLAPEPLDAPPLSQRNARLASWWIAGLMTTADWIGSGVRWFHFTAPLPGDSSLAGYWAITRQAADDAVCQSGLAAPPVAPRRSFAELTRIERPPTPAQCWAETTALPAGPCLVLIEDVTGAGKTEAAQLIVHRLLVEGRAAGAYWAMPTQATANAMYARQSRALDRLYADSADPRPSLVLAHGQQRLHEGFRATVLDGATGDAAASTHSAASSDADRDDAPGTSTCAAFLADDRRAALLADVGAGTVDQALLGILPSRFNTVRLFGLSDRVLVVDEAHAYDAYVGIEVRELLRFQAALGGCAVVLSATLPRTRRAELVEAWMQGLRQSGWAAEARADHESEVLRSDAYPLATLASGDGVREDSLAAAPWSKREVKVRLIHEVDDAIGEVARLAGAGAAVAWVRNAVDDCLDAASRLRERGVERVIVFHARFAQCDRQQREAEVLRRFGREAGQAERAGWVLVATQVVEQSLDLDFDAMISDLAPIDLLIQRAGRLQRHPERNPSRPAGCELELVVLSPPPIPDAPADWLAGPFKGTGYVYQNPGILWRTARLLADKKQIVTPLGLRALIEGVYAPENLDCVPPQLSTLAERAEGKDAGYAATANYSTLRLTHGYDASQQAWLSELRVPTRLGDDTTTLRLARVCRDGRLAPWAEGAIPPWKAWALSEVRVRSTRVPADAAPAPEYAARVAATRAEWGRYEQEIPILPLAECAEEPGVWCGVLYSAERKTPVQARYSAANGLVLIRT
jgi:CRISPR-associated endonuclease/helicase Cas3